MIHRLMNIGISHSAETLEPGEIAGRWSSASVTQDDKRWVADDPAHIQYSS